MPSKKTSGKKKPVGRLKQYQERKQAKEALKRSEALFSSAFRMSPAATILSKLQDGLCIDANEAYARLVGFSREELLGRTTTELNIWMSPDERDRIVSELARSGRLRNVSITLRKKDGSLCSTLASGEIITIEGKRCILSFFYDITERKHAEDELRESEERFSKAFKTSPYAYMIANMKDGRIIEVNDAFTTMSGFTREEALAGSTLSLKLWVDEKDRQVMVATLRDGRAVKRLETRLQGKNGNIKTALLSAQVIQLGNRPCILSIVEDITERKRAEEAIAAEKERLAVTLRSIGDGVITTDIRGGVVTMNKVAEEITGWTQSEVYGRPLETVFTIINEITRQPCENPVAKVLSTGHSIELANHTLCISHNGVERVIADSGAPIKDRDGKAIGVVLVFRDMTEKRKILDAIQRTARLDSLGVLAGGIAHDFNNLLTGIFGYIDLARSVSKEARTLEYLEATLATMNRARALTFQLLTFAKGGSPVQKITPLVPFIQETAQFALSGSNISCQFFLAENLWPCNIDKNQIGQVIDNIVINAQQAMPGGGAIEITAENVTLTENEHPMLRPLNPPKGDLTDGVPPSGEPMGRGREVRNYVKVSIKDSGIGIPKNIIPRIFDPFYTTKIKGHGLGLATCYSIINRHGGCIDVESEQGKGSTFHVYLPASTEAIVANAATILKHRGSGTIIVIDDEEVVRETVRKMLESMGYTVVCKNDGKEAIGFFMSETAQRHFAAMIFDLTIPGGMGGTEAVAEVRKLDKEIPVFVASGYADNSVMMDPVAYGFTASISKPFTIAELSEMLNRNLKK